MRRRVPLNNTQLCRWVALGTVPYNNALSATVTRSRTFPQQLKLSYDYFKHLSLDMYQTIVLVQARRHRLLLLGVTAKDDRRTCVPLKLTWQTVYSRYRADTDVTWIKPDVVYSDVMFIQRVVLFNLPSAMNCGFDRVQKENEQQWEM